MSEELQQIDKELEDTESVISGLAVSMKGNFFEKIATGILCGALISAYIHKRSLLKEKAVLKKSAFEADQLKKQKQNQD